MSAVYTFGDLIDQVLANLDESDNTDTTLTLAKSFLNQAHSARCGQAEWTFLRWENPETFTVSTTRRVYGLHPEAWKFLYFFNRDTKEYLREIPIRSLPAAGSRWNTDTARASTFRFLGHAPVERQPATTGTISILSSSTSDTTAAKAITFEIETANGITTESITPNGTTAVSSTNSVERILSITRGDDWVGNLTVRDSSSNTLLTLFPTELGRLYPQIELLATPTAADTVEYNFLRKPRLLVADNDIPNIPYPHSQILVWDALVMFGGYNTNLDAKNLRIWASVIDQLEKDLLQIYVEGATLEAEPRYVRDLGDDAMGYLPRVHG